MHDTRSRREEPHAVSGAFEVDLKTLKPHDRYKLLCALVVPRPIALVTTLGSGGMVNAAPFSFFNVFSEDPPIVALGLYGRPEGGRKDTYTHIRNVGAFVVNLIDEPLATRMNICAVDFPSDVSELDAAKFSTLPSTTSPVPRIAEAVAALECRHYQTLELSAHRHLCLGEVVHVHARMGIVDPVRLYVNLDAYKPVARLFGNLYAGLRETFQLKRQSYAEWLASRDAKED
jgi:flavin reductase (DIM6/NTAB) family NADH-FMN oxidoreductase RutF